MSSTLHCNQRALKALYTKVGIAEIINYLFKLLSHEISFAHITQLLLVKMLLQRLIARTEGTYIVFHLH